MKGLKIAMYLIQTSVAEKENMEEEMNKKQLNAEEEITGVMYT